MPKDKNQKNENQNNNLINQKKNLKNLIYQKWKESEEKKIEDKVKQVQNKEDEKIKEQEKEIDQNAAKKLLLMKDNIKKEWQAHLTELGRKLDCIDEKLAADITAALERLDTEYQQKEAEEKEKYEKKLEEIEKEEKPIQDAVNEGKKRISEGKEKCQEELNKCWEEIGKISVAIGGYSEESNHAPHDVQDKLQKKIEKQRLALTTANQRIETWNAAFEALEKEEKELSKVLDPFEERRKKAESEYTLKLAELAKEKADKLVAEKSKAEEEKEKLRHQYEADKKLEYHPDRCKSLSEEIENQAYYKKMMLSRNRTAVAAQTKKDLTTQMNATGKAFLDRLYESVYFGFKVDELENSEKSHGSSNTNEFERMVEALKDAEKAVGTGEVSAQVDENIRKNCLRAYKECRNYLQKKNRGWSLLEKMRSETGKKRIEMARGMMVNLKKFYPDLEADLEAERNRENEAHAEQAEEKRESVKKSGKNPTRNISGELKEAKAIIRKQQGKKEEIKTNPKKNNNTNQMKKYSK